MRIHSEAVERLTHSGDIGNYNTVESRDKAPFPFLSLYYI